MTSLPHDLRYTLRQLRKSPAFALTAILVLALGIGATVAMFSVISAVLLKPLGYRQPNQLILVSGGFTPVRFEELKATARSYSELAAYAGVSEDMALSGIEQPEVLKGARVSANFLHILGMAPAQGRSFLPEEDKPGAPGVALISMQLWQRRFAGDSRIVGQTVTLEGAPHTIIGVMPPGFQFPFAGLDVWVPKPTESALINPGSRPFSPTLAVLGRLKPSLTIHQAKAELTVLDRQYAAAHPAMLDAKPDPSAHLLPLKEELISDIRPKLWMLFGSVGLVLLIVCANIGSLLLARATSRAGEFAVRVAIGAGRGRIVRQLLAESILLASVGGALGIALAGLCLRLVRNVTFIDLPRAGEIRLDGGVLGFALLLSVGTGILFGLVPAFAASRPNLTGVLKGSPDVPAPPGSIPFMRFGLRGLLVIGQVTLSITLLIAAALLIESLAHLYRADPGFEPSHLLTMRIALPPARYDTQGKRSAFFTDLVQRAESLPRVRAAAVTLTLPLTGFAGMPVQLAKGQLLRLNQRPIGTVQLITPDYFRTLGIAVKRGRPFTEHDNDRSNPVVIIDESLAHRLFPDYPDGLNPIGQQMLIGRDTHPHEIVGVASNVYQAGKDQNLRPGFYLPCAQSSTQLAMLAVRTDGDPLLLATAIRNQVFAIDPAQPVSDVRTMDDIVEESEGQVRVMMGLLGAFAGAAALLAVIGLYAVISYSTAQRTKELGIRAALGAQRRDIISLVVRQGLSLSVVGVLLGAGAALALTRLLKDLLFQVRPTDPATFIAVSALFVLVALAASYIPARRAARVEPMEALRYE
jgi:predicted permease